MNGLLAGYHTIELLHTCNGVNDFAEAVVSPLAGLKNFLALFLFLVKRQNNIWADRKTNKGENVIGFSSLVVSCVKIKISG